MDGLIEALTILKGYDNPKYPTHCEHDVLYVFVSPDLVSDEDMKRLDDLGFIPSEDDDCFLSYRYGSA